LTMSCNKSILYLGVGIRSTPNVAYWLCPPPLAYLPRVGGVTGSLKGEPSLMKDKYEYNYQPCNICGKPATDRHHCLIGRSKRYPILNHPFNLEPLCRSCHSMGLVNSYDHRKQFFEQRVREFGSEFRDWWESLPVKVKPRYE
jgi:hypothetical protein